MNNQMFVDEENIQLIQDEDYDNYGTPNTSRVDETSIMEADTSEATSTLRLNQKVKPDKLAALYRHLNVKGNLEQEQILGLLVHLQRPIHTSPAF